jgi:SAM-dependent methyltransferase
MVEWCMDNVPPSGSPSILEIGAGNGALLTSLVEAGYNPQLIQGIDYSPGAIQLAQKVASSRGDACSKITYSVCDFLYENVPQLGDACPSFHLVLDKGTFDAIALAKRNSDGSTPSHLYPKRLASALLPGGYFLITCILPFLSTSREVDPHPIQLATLPKKN